MCLHVLLGYAGSGPTGRQGDGGSPSSKRPYPMFFFVYLTPELFLEIEIFDSTAYSVNHKWHKKVNSSVFTFGKTMVLLFFREKIPNIARWHWMLHRQQTKAEQTKKQKTLMNFRDSNPRSTPN